MPLSKVRLPDRHPYEPYLLGACAAFAAGDLLDVFPTPASVTQQLPFTWLWSVLLLVGSALVLVTFFWPRRPGVFNVNLLLLEQVGLVTAGVSAGVYAIVLAKSNGLAGAFPILMNGGFCAASVAQAVIIQRFIRQIRAALREAARIAAEAAFAAAYNDTTEGGT